MSNLIPINAQANKLSLPKIIYWLTLLIFIIGYFIRFIVNISDSSLFILITGVSIIWSFIIGLISVKTYLYDRFVFVLKNMIIAMVILAIAPLIVMIGGTIVTNNVLTIEGVLNGVILFFVMQIGFLLLYTLGGFTVGFLLSLPISVFFRQPRHRSN